jgi:hypothetical protein
MAAHRTLSQRLPRGRTEELSRAEREIRYEYNRRRYLPQQYTATRLRLRHLEAEAARLGVELPEGGL